MRKIALFFFLCGTIFGLSFAAARWISERKPVSNSEMTADKNWLGGRFSPNPYPLENRPFAIVIAARNNGAYVEKTLRSVFSQNYENYRLIYIDDASDDGSFELARDLIYESGQLMRVTLVRNEEKLGPLANIFRAIQTCPDREIALILQGEDWLSHEWVLQRLNAYYSDPDLWMTFGHYQDFPTFQPGICRSFRLQDLEEKGFRSHPFVASHLKTFYAGLFKKISEADFVHQGQFLQAASDLAYMLPMLEMARDHFQFVPDILYIANRLANQKEDRELHLRCEKWVRSLASYAPLETLFSPPSEEPMLEGTQ